MITPGTYRIRNVQSGTILDLGKQQWVYVIGWEQNGRDNQLWYVQREGDKVLLKNCAAGNYASVYNHHRGVKVHGCSNPLPWELIDSGSGYFIGTPGQNRVMELDQGLRKNGTPIFVRQRTGAQHQKWSFEKINDDSGQGGGYYPQPQQGSLPPNQPAPQYQPPPQEQHTPSSQPSLPPPQTPSVGQPSPITVNPGIYVIRNVLTGTVLDRWGDAGNANGVPVGCRYNGEINQQWKISSTNNGRNVSICSLQDDTYASVSELETIKPSPKPEDFELTAANNGFYISPAQKLTHALELLGNTSEVMIKWKTGDPSQKWRFELCTN